MKSLVDLMGVLLQDAGSWCRVSTSRDLQTIATRVKHEGESFLTITLPAFGRDFERSLEEGQVAHDAFPGFSRWRGLPRFLGGFLELVFDRGTGLLLDSPSITAIHSIRQLCLVLGKLHAECGDRRNRHAIEEYIKCETEVKTWGDTVSETLLGEFRSAFLRLWGDVCHSLDTKVSQGEMVPRHGPGATADRLQGNQKWNQAEWTRRLEGYFPSADFLIPNHRYWEALDTVDFREPGRERPVKVTLVPKTPKTPRIIAVEPTCMQYAQQALLGLLVPHVDDSVTHSLIGIRDQGPNQTLAQVGSIDGSLATLDLSEASDRVSNKLIQYAFKPYSHLSGALQACRSRRASVPGRTRPITLAKFASMGSAVCFPVEAMVFSTIAIIGIERQLRRQLRPLEIHNLKGSVRVYGDDIIVPTDMTLSVIGALSDFGLKVNRHKSFWTGKFRESCGREYYDGNDVSIVRVREYIPDDRHSSGAVAATISSRNQFYKAGYWKTAAFLDDVIRTYGPYPIVEETAQALGRHSFLPAQGERLSRDTHTPIVRCMKIAAKIPRSPLGGLGALMKFFISRGSEPMFDEKHLQRSGRPRSVDIKIGWSAVY